jgi:hypothetical protein
LAINIDCGSADGAGLDTPRTTRKEKERLKLVCVSWIDSYTDGGWADYAPEKVETNTYGILVGKTRDWTTLAMTKEKGYWGNLWYIPTKNVLRIRSIEDSAG